MVILWDEFRSQKSAYRRNILKTLLRDNLLSSDSICAMQLFNFGQTGPMQNHCIYHQVSSVRKT